MCIVLQEAIRQGKSEGKKIGIIEGEKKGEDRFARLVSLLISSGRLDDVKKAAENKIYRNELYDKFKIF